MKILYKCKETGKICTEEEVVDWFQSINESWWSEISGLPGHSGLPRQAFFGKKPLYRSLLIEYMRTGEEIEDINHEGIICLKKFDEWLTTFEVELI